MQLYTDSSGARGILQPQEVGRLRHLSRRILWLQNLINAVRLGAIAGTKNLAECAQRVACIKDTLSDEFAWNVQYFFWHG